MTKYPFLVQLSRSCLTCLLSPNEWMCAHTFIHSCMYWRRYRYLQQKFRKISVRTVFFGGKNPQNLISFRDEFCLKCFLSNFLTCLLAQENFTKQEISIVPSESPEPAHRVHVKLCECYQLSWTLLQSHFHITEGKVICCWVTSECLIKHCLISTNCF